MPSFLCQAHSPHSPGGCDFCRFKVCLTVTTVLLPAGGRCTAGMARMTHELWTHCSMGWHPATVETNGLFRAVVPSLKYGSVKTMGFPFTNACTIKKITYAVRHIGPQCVDESVNAILQKKKKKKVGGHAINLGYLFVVFTFLWTQFVDLFDTSFTNMYFSSL